MSEPDFDIDMVAEFLAAAVRHDPGDIYAQPRFVNLKLGFYVSYELVKLRQQASKKALADKTAPTPITRTTAKSAIKVQMEIPGSRAKFTLPMKYVVQYADVTLKAHTPIGPPFEFDLDDYLRRAKTAPDRFHHLTATRTLGDAVHDTGRDLARAGFVYHTSLTAMSASARKAYKKNIADVTFVPADSAPDSPIYMHNDENRAYFGSLGFEFKKLLAQTCTYDASGAYFDKWTADALKRQDRSFVGADLAPTYFARTTGEYELEQGYYYGLLTSPVLQRLYRLSPDQKTGYRLDLLVGLDESLLIPPGTAPDFDALPTPDLIIFKAEHGAKKGSAKKGLKQPTFQYHKVATGAFERLADPQREVEGDLGKEVAKKLRARSEFDWFVELAGLRFTETLYVLDIKRAMAQAREGGINEMTFLPDYRKASVAELAIPLWEWAGTNPIRLAALERTRVVLDDEDLLPIPQGLMISDNVKFVGCDADFAYARDLARDVTVKMPHAALIADLAERYKYKLLYKNSEGMIYVSQIIVWGGLIAVGAAIIPGALAVRTVYRMVANRARSYAMDKAVQQVLIYELPAMAAVVAQVLSGLFAGTYPKAELWEAFAKGFFRGYAVNSLKKIFFNLQDGLADALLKEWKLYQNMKKLHHTVKQLSAKFDELSAKLDEKHLEALVKQFENSAGESMQAALVLFQMISFLAHNEAEDVLVGLSAALTEDPMDKLVASEWYIEAKEAVVDSVASVGSYLNGEGRAIFDKVDGVFTFVEKHDKILAGLALAAVAVSLAKQMAALKQLESTRTSPKKIAVVVAGLLAGGAVLHLVTDGASTAVVKDIGENAAQSLPGSDTPNAELRGQIYGSALGALFFDHGLIGSKSAVGRLANHDKIAKRVRKTAKFGIVMPLLSVLLQRYVIAFRKALGYDGQSGDVDDLLKDLARWRTDSPELRRFEAYRKTETGVDLHEMMSAILHIERFLNAEVRDRWKSKWGPRVESYEADLRSFRDDAKSLGIDALVKQHAPVIGISMLLQLRAVVGSMRRGFEHMAEEADVVLEDGSKLSILRLIEMLGFDLGDLDTVMKQFDDDVAMVAKEYRKS